MNVAFLAKVLCVPGGQGMICYNRNVSGPFDAKHVVSKVGPRAATHACMNKGFSVLQPDALSASAVELFLRACQLFL